MAGYKPRRANKRYAGKRSTKPKTRKAKPMSNTKSLVKLIRRVTLKTQETKRSLNVNSAKSTVVQSRLLSLDSVPLRTGNGTSDPETGGLYQNRIGDDVTPVGLKIKFMVALDPRQSQVKFRWMFIKSAFGDVPTTDNLFKGISNNKQLDEIDTERFTIMAQKFFTIYRGNAAVSAPGYTTTIVQQSGSDTGMEYDGKQNQQWIPKLCSAWIPGSKFGKVLKYQNGSQTPKMFGYHSFLIAYGCDQATDDGIIFSGTSLARMDDYVSTFYFKDA